MELDDMKLAWQTLDRRLELHNALELDMFKERKFDKIKSGLRPLVFGQILQIALGVLLTSMSAPFWFEHMQTPHLLLCGLSLHAYALMMIVFAVRDLYMIFSIDYSSPVLDIQKRIAELRAWHLRIGPIFALTGSVVWIPMGLVIFYWLGADVWVHSPNFVYWLIANGVVCLGLVYGFIRWSRSSRSKFARSLEDSAAGRGVSRAQAVLAEIARFEDV